jgi:hypothetical protein
VYSKKKVTNSQQLFKFKPLEFGFFSSIKIYNNHKELQNHFSKIRCLFCRVKVHVADEHFTSFKGKSLAENKVAIQQTTRNPPFYATTEAEVGEWFSPLVSVQRDTV